MGQHRILAYSLDDLRSQLNDLPESVILTSDVVQFDVQTTEDITFGGGSVRHWHLVLDLEWPVEPV